MESVSDSQFPPLVFWQPILSPHQTPLLERLTIDWPSKIYLVVNREIDFDRENDSGWETKAPLRVIVTTNGLEVPTNAIHIVSGFHGPKEWQTNLSRIVKDKKSKVWIMAESLETWDHPIKTVFRFAKHGIARFKLHRRFSGFLAIGDKAESQARLLAVPKKKIHPFAYITAPPASFNPVFDLENPKDAFPVLFIGSIIKRKGIDVLFETVLPAPSRLLVVGAHTDQSITIPNHVEYLGVVPNLEINNLIANVSVLILPSRHDGWGAVINEALSVGTPVICTSECGGATLIKTELPFRGKVVKKLTTDTLSNAIDEVMSSDVDRNLIAEWASTSISPKPVSRYLTELLSGKNSTAPWRTE